MSKKINIGKISSQRQFEINKPRFNGFSNGCGKHGDFKYNRRNIKKETERIIKEESDA